MSINVSATQESQSSLLFTVASRVKPPGERKLGPGFGKDKMGKKDTTDGGGK